MPSIECFMFFLLLPLNNSHIQISPRALRELVLEDHMLLSSKDVYVGREADAFRSQNPKHAVSMHNVTFVPSQRHAAK